MPQHKISTSADDLLRYNSFRRNTIGRKKPNLPLPE
jgi:hypothetical protein